MPLIKRTTTIAIGARATPLDDSQYRFLPFDALVQFAVLADAADLVDATIFSGTDVLMENTRLDALAVATPITFPDDYSLEDVAAAGEPLGVNLVNVDPAIVVVRTSVRITPL